MATIDLTTIIAIAITATIMGAAQSLTVRYLSRILDHAEKRYGWNTEKKSGGERMKWFTSLPKSLKTSLCLLVAFLAMMVAGAIYRLLPVAMTGFILAFLCVLAALLLMKRESTREVIYCPQCNGHNITNCPGGTCAKPSQEAKKNIKYICTDCLCEFGDAPLKGSDPAVVK